MRNTLLLLIYFSIILPSILSNEINKNNCEKIILSEDKNIQDILNDTHNKYKNLKEGNNANYIPVLDEMDPELFGIVLVTTNGKVYGTGDVNNLFSIQSISKVFTLARVVEDFNATTVENKIGVDATGMKFNSIVAIEMNQGKEMNPFVNPGAIACTSLVNGKTYEEKWNNILQIHSDFAGRDLEVNEIVYKSEAANNQRNQAIAKLLDSYERIYFDPSETIDLYTKQCAINVNVRDLGIMAATLSNGGKNPMTNQTIVSPTTVQHVLAVMATAGLYDDSGIWLYNVGVPAKSGVGGGIIAVVPNLFGIAAFSPRLDHTGNSIRAQKAIKDIIDRLMANPYLIYPK